MKEAFTLYLKCGVAGCEYMDKLQYLKAKEDEKHDIPG